MAMLKGEQAASSTQVAPGAMDVMGHQQMTSLSSATAPTITAGTRWILAQAESQSVRWRCDGTAPTASVGMIIYAGDAPTILPIASTSIANLKFIEVAASAKLNLTYLG